jgi:hypothetical protein
VIAVRQGHYRRMIWQRLVDLINGHIKLEEQSAVALIPNHTLYPEDRREPGAARHRRNMMQAGRWIGHHLASGSLDGMCPVQIVDDEFAAIVFVWLAQKERGCKVGADTKRGARDLPHRIVQMRAQRHTRLIPAS